MQELIVTLQQQVTDLEATIERQRIWAQVGMKGKADDDRENAERLVAVNKQVTELEGKAALADVLLAGDPLVDNAPEAGVGTFSKICRWCGWSGQEPHLMSPAAIHKLPGYGHHPECPKLRYDALTSPSTIAQKEMASE